MISFECDLAGAVGIEPTTLGFVPISHLTPFGAAGDQISSASSIAGACAEPDEVGSDSARIQFETPMLYQLSYAPRRPLFYQKLCEQLPHLLLQLLDVFKLPMHRRIADVRDFIELFKLLHHITTDRRTCDFLLVLAPLLLEL